MYAGVPFMFQRFAALAQRGDLSSLPVGFSGSVPLSEDNHRAFAHAYTFTLFQMYGSAETGSISIHAEGARVWGFNSVGSPIPSVSVQIVDDIGGQVPTGARGAFRSRVDFPHPRTTA